MIKQLTCLLAILFGFTAAALADSPNIILILTDDQGWSQQSGLMEPENPESRSSYLHTPAMDRERGNAWPMVPSSQPYETMHTFGSA